MRYLIVTGQSGAGKTACVRYLEDKGSFCMDNMPPMMLPKLIEAFDTTPVKHQTVTIAVDVRSGEFFDANAVAKMIRELRQMGHEIELIFMEASDETLLDRYKETRREHPLCQEGLTLIEAIVEERTRLQPLRETAGYVIDTTNMTARAMKKALDRYARELAVGLCSLYMVFRPQAIVLGGGVSAGGDMLLESVLSHVPSAYNYDAGIMRGVLRIASRQNEAGMLGAAVLAKMHLSAPET